MRKHTNTIHINGQKYNARTGELLTHSPVAEVVPGPEKKPTKPKRSVETNHTSSEAHNLVRSPSGTQTLMRRTVRKPGLSLKRQLKVYSQINNPAEQQPLIPFDMTQPASQLNELRLKHAKKVSKSNLVSRFSPGTTLALTEPTSATLENNISDISDNVDNKQKTTAHKPVKRTKTTAALLEQAIANSTSHAQPPPPVSKRHTKRQMGIGAGISLVAVMFAILISQNLSSIKLQVASSKAGFHASIPHYQPAGFSLAHLDYASGSVSMQFQSNSDQRHFTISQQPTNWTSEDLRNNFVVSTSANFQTLENQNRTIYIYGQGNTTWVNGGLWYILHSDGSLGNRQLMNIATSIK
ncbi:MAG TPA: hypothetical protein VLF79_00305 [Candidatus Saccharimonadales bacterium]|nr:hypothetical protein [Candidatus Saccharimonadales bacterium]